MYSELIEAAKGARNNAHAPYSKFKVGAAVLLENGEIVTGCNVENASYGLSLCAERIAIFKAVSEGQIKFSAIAIVAETERFTPPCGACRQIMWEFCGDIPVILADLKDQSEKLMLVDLLPLAFDSEFLNN